MSEYDELSPARKAAIRADNARHHGSVTLEIAFRLEDARARAFDETIAWLGANGFTKASMALERVAFEQVSLPHALAAPTASGTPGKPT